MTEYINIVCSYCGRIIGQANPPAPTAPVVCADCKAKDTNRPRDDRRER